MEIRRLSKNKIKASECPRIENFGGRAADPDPHPIPKTTTTRQFQEAGAWAQKQLNRHE